MKTRIFRALCLAILSVAWLHAQSQETDIDKRTHWESIIPKRITLADQAHTHSTKYVSKHYLYQSTGKVADFFKEMGRPDKFSLQIFSVTDKQQLSLAKYPLHGSFKYEFQDGTRVYMTSARMDWISLAVLYKDGKFNRLLYK